MKLLPVALALGMTVSAPAAKALTFNVSTIAGDTLNASQLAAFTAATTIWGGLLTDNVAVTLQIGFTTLGSGTLAQTAATSVFANAATVEQRLAIDATSANDAIAVAHLPSTSSLGNSNLVLTGAVARALGFTTPTITVDATIEFNSSISFATTRNNDGSTPAGLYDMIGVALHEIGHVLGFVSDADSALPRRVLDLFRYVPGSSTLSFTNGAAAAFSIDGGATDLASFATGTNAQASHWAPGSTANAQSLLMDPALASGTTQNIQPLDLVAMDVIGWDVAAQAVPEPGTFMLVAAGLAALSGRRRKLSRRG